MDRVTRLIISVSVFSFWAASLAAQTIRFDSGAFSPNAACVTGKSCSVVPMPDVQVHICAAEKPGCVPAATFVDATGKRRCPSTKPLAPRKGEAECLASAGADGNFSVWLQPGSYTYSLSLTTRSGPKSFGPFPFLVQRNPSGYKSDADYSTFDAACSAAGSGTLAVSRRWENLEAGNFACNLLFLPGGVLQPAPKAKLTLRGAVAAPLDGIFDIARGGAILPENVPEIYPQWFGAVSNPDVDSSAQIQAAQIAAAQTGKPLHFPAGQYGICNVVVKTANSVEDLGDGPELSQLRRHRSCLQAKSNMLDITTSGLVSLRSLGIDMLGNGKTFSNDAILVSNASEVRLRDLHIAHGQVVGFQCSNCSNVSDSGSTYYQNWWFGKSISCSQGGTAKPVYNTGFSDSNVRYEDQPIGLGYNFFCSDIKVSDDVFVKSGLAFVQMPNARATVNDISVDGVADFGCLQTSQCATSKSNNALFMEGVSNITVNGGSISNFTGQEGAVFCIGSQLQIPKPEGPVLQLPCSHVSINRIKINNTTGNSILIRGQSFDDSVQGVDNSINQTTVTNSTQCPIMLATERATVEGNDCEMTQNGGYIMGRVRHGVFRDNRGHNIGTAAPGRYTGLLINDDATEDVTVENNQFTEDSGHSLLRCFADETTAAGVARVKRGANTCKGAATEWYEAPRGSR